MRLIIEAKIGSLAEVPPEIPYFVLEEGCFIATAVQCNVVVSIKINTAVVEVTVSSTIVEKVICK